MNMGYIQSSKSITQRVENKLTGELELQVFYEEKKLIEIKGGYVKMYYKNYDAIMIDIVKSSLDARLFIYIRNHFTYDKKEVLLSSTKIAKRLKTSKQKVTGIIKQLVADDFIYRVDRGIYRLNPFVYIPYRADGEVLQDEWKKMKEKKIEPTT